jgi:CBS domain-containing protein
MTLVRQILEIKGYQVLAVGPDEMVIDALKLMKTKDVGAVLVMDGESLVGIFTERH